MSDNDPTSGAGGQPPVPPPSQQPSAPPPQPNYGAPVQGQPYGQQPVAKTNGLAVASLVLGLLWICYLGSVLAVIFGHIGLSQIKNSGGTQTGQGLAIAGLILGYLGIAVLVLSLLLGFGTYTFDAGT